MSDTAPGTTAVTRRWCAACGKPTTNIYRSGCCGGHVRYANTAVTATTRARAEGYWNEVAMFLACQGVPDEIVDALWAELNAHRDRAERAGWQVTRFGIDLYRAVAQ